MFQRRRGFVWRRTNRLSIYRRVPRHYANAERVQTRHRRDCHSHVVGYGMWIALDTDIRVAADNTSFWLPEPQWGIATIPAAWFPRIMPWAIASELLLMAERVDAERAYQVGLVNKVVAPEQLMG